MGLDLRERRGVHRLALVVLGADVKLVVVGQVLVEGMVVVLRREVAPRRGLRVAGETEGEDGDHGEPEAWGGKLGGGGPGQAILHRSP